jgi:hypothetical protein
MWHELAKEECVYVIGGNARGNETTKMTKMLVGGKYEEESW